MRKRGHTLTSPGARHLTPFDQPTSGDPLLGRAQRNVLRLSLNRRRCSLRCCRRAIVDDPTHWTSASLGVSYCPTAAGGGGWRSGEGIPACRCGWPRDIDRMAVRQRRSARRPALQVLATKPSWALAAHSAILVSHCQSFAMLGVNMRARVLSGYAGPKRPLLWGVPRGFILRQTAH